MLFLLSVVVIGAVVVAAVISPSSHSTSLDLLYLDWRHALPPPDLPDICGMKIQVGIVHPPVTFKKTVNHDQHLSNFSEPLHFHVRVDRNENSKSRSFTNTNFTSILFVFVFVKK